MSLHQQTTGVSQDKTQISLQIEEFVQRTLKDNSLTPSLQQSRTQEKDGKKWLLFYKKIRISRNASMESLESLWKGLQFQGDFKVWQVKTSETPSSGSSKGKIIDVELGTTEFVTPFSSFPSSESPDCHHYRRYRLY